MKTKRTKDWRVVGLRRARKIKGLKAAVQRLREALGGRDKHAARVLYRRTIRALADGSVGVRGAQYELGMVPSRILNALFDWKLTPEGHDYWSSTEQRLRAWESVGKQTKHGRPVSKEDYLKQQLARIKAEEAAAWAAAIDAAMGVKTCKALEQLGLVVEAKALRALLAGDMTLYEETTANSAYAAKCNSLHDWLYCRFVWKKTPQGHEYWKRCCNALVDGKVPEKPAVPSVPERRRLKLEAMIVMAMEVAVCRVVSQTHRGTEFTVRGSAEFDHEGMRITSAISPEFDGHVLYVRGSSKERDAKAFTVPLDKLDAVRKAVRRYNETNGGEEKGEYQPPMDGAKVYIE